MKLFLTPAEQTMYLIQLKVINWCNSARRKVKCNLFKDTILHVTQVFFPKVTCGFIYCFNTKLSPLHSCNALLLSRDLSLGKIPNPIASEKCKAAVSPLPLMIKEHSRRRAALKAQI